MKRPADERGCDRVKPQSLFAKMGAAKVASGGDGEGNVEG